MSHSSPSQPLEQKHLNESTSSIHVPPFLQGFPRQSLISTMKSQQLLLKAVFTYSEEWSTFVSLGKAAQSYYCICPCKRKAQTSVFKSVSGCTVSHIASPTRALHLPGKNIWGFKNTQTSNTSSSPFFVILMLEKSVAHKIVHKGSRYRHIYTEVGLNPVFYHRGSVNLHKGCYQKKQFQAVHLKQHFMQLYWNLNVLFYVVKLHNINFKINFEQKE